MRDNETCGQTEVATNTDEVTEVAGFFEGILEVAYILLGALVRGLCTTEEQESNELSLEEEEGL